MNAVDLGNKEVARTASILNLIAGLWLIISPFWMNFLGAPAALWNTCLTGVAVGVLSLIRACYPLRNVGLSWINLILGVWLIVSPFFLPYNYLEPAVRNSVITGIVVIVLAFWSAMATPAAVGRLTR
jgi:hypothetical protein